MKITKLFREERAVSPVIGVILMVAITVILAAVIGTFVLDLGQNVGGSNAPQATFQFEQNGSVEDDSATVEIRHAGGETLDPQNIEVRIGGDNVDNPFDGDISAGTAIDVDISTESADEDVTVVWISPSTDKTAILARHTLS